MLTSSQWPTTAVRCSCCWNGPSQSLAWWRSCQKKLNWQSSDVFMAAMTVLAATVRVTTRLCCSPTRDQALRQSRAASLSCWPARVRASAVVTACRWRRRRSSSRSWRQAAHRRRRLRSSLWWPLVSVLWETHKSRVCWVQQSGFIAQKLPRNKHPTTQLQIQQMQKQKPTPRMPSSMRQSQKTCLFLRIN